MGKGELKEYEEEEKKRRENKRIEKKTGKSVEREERSESER